ncbi:hypothetical protein XCR_2348 [Xanthomonas campestris pv. raphani 756C]|nr:hypothetical protein XCR_2348 [Xanthomonas campestris pv. raphani 756C]
MSELRNFARWQSSTVDHGWREFMQSAQRRQPKRPYGDQYWTG